MPGARSVPDASEHVCNWISDVHILTNSTS
jgi:hypothetical protein